MPDKVGSISTSNSQKERLFRRIQVTYDMIQKLPENQDIFLARVDKLEDTFKEFNEVILKISELNLTVPKENQIDISQTTTAFEELYFAITAAKNGIKATNTPNPANETVSNINVLKNEMDTKPTLPQINIPLFKGDIEQFPTFLSLFNSLIHESKLSNIVKFSHLKTLLLPPASNTIDSIEFRAENYVTAYNKLVNRYSNKRIVAAHLYDKILKFSPLSTDSISGLRSFLDTFDDSYKAMKALEIPDLSNFMMLHLGLNAIDKYSRRLFERQYTENQIPKFEDLCSFIQTQCRVAELCKDNAPYNIKGKAQTKRGQSFLSSQGSSTSPQTFSKNDKTVTIKCPICFGSHNILQCSSFLSASISGRYELLKKHKRCFSCAGAHRLDLCKSKGHCQHCGSNKHNTLIHLERIPTSSPPLTKAQVSLDKDQSTTESCTLSHSCASSSAHHVLLSTARARILSQDGVWIPCRILVDNGSTVNFITSSLAHRLGLSRRCSSVPVSGVGDTSLPVSLAEVDCTIGPSGSSSQTFQFTSLVLPKIVSKCPPLSISPQIKGQLASIKLADPDFDKPSSIDLLIGAQVYSEILSNPPAFIKGEPSALLTSLGWILFGKVPVTFSVETSAFSCLTQPTLQDEVRRFWETEEVTTVIPESPEDKHCEDHYRKTVLRDSLGHYVVSLPFNKMSEYSSLNPTRDIALQRLDKLERRFLKNPDYRDLYHAQMEDYILSNHVEPASFPSNYVLTHHGVLKDSSSTKLRVVFNGSEHAPGSQSLNDLLPTGPILQTDIGRLINNFRLYPIALTCDVKQMFRCIKLNECDRKFVHFFWRFHPTEPVQEFQLTTLPFGLRCSPYLAIRTLIQLFEDEGHKFPRAAQSLKEIYMDNLVSGAATVEDATELCNQLVSLFASGGFTLRKFCSNSSEVLGNIPLEHHEIPLHLDDPQTVKVLGLKWNPQTDQLCYSINIIQPVFTKRGILSVAARIFDVNGYICPVIFWIKCLLQKLWLLHADWDDLIPSELNKIWASFLQELPLLSQVTLPRYVLNHSPSALQIISFADASDKGYGCVVYLRIEDSNGLVDTQLIRAKSKVAPLKVLSIPRLELNAALLLSKVLHSLQTFISRLEIQQIYCFSDSFNVLWWLQTPPHQLKTYVANRVVQIHDNVDHASWHYISTKENPADCVSRGLTPKEIIRHEVYWKGPSFMRLPIDQWPLRDLDPPISLPEVKALSFLSTSKVNETWSHFEKFSSLVKIQRVMSYVLRFLSYMKNKSCTSTKSTALSSKELKNALHKYIFLTQRHHFSDLLSSLENGEMIEGNLNKLNPFLSSEGLIRVGGRLKNALIPEHAKHPILIPKNSHLAVLLCDFYHIYTLHGGPLLMQSLIHRHYWIPSLRQLIRKRIFQCLICYKSKVKPKAPFMSDLPTSRVTPSRAFQEVGVDYGGPFIIKESRRRNSTKSKSWIALFVCMCTKAVHMELVTSLSTTAFFAALDRFIARRGLPNSVYSDQGTNFLGARRKLKELFHFLSSKQQEICDHLTRSNIEWHFNPPSAPHFGGLWEAAIKSAKRHLHAVLQDQVLTYEEFNTLLNRVEAVLNSRPLCSVSNLTADNLDYLSPGHFLIGQPLLTVPESSEVERFPLNTRWELVNRSLRHFWKRWSQEYLHTLTTRSKWTSSRSNITSGSLVLLREKDTSPQHWILGRVIEVFPGSDGVVRVVKLRTANSTIVRPVHKIVPLPEGNGH